MLYRTLTVVLLAFFVVGCAAKQTPLQLTQSAELLDRSMIEGTITTNAALEQYEDLYDDHKDNDRITAGYADALRRAGQPKKSADILRPIIKDTSIQDLSHPVFMSYMRLLLDQKYYKDVESRVKSRLSVQPDNKAVAAELYHVMGLALAGQGNSVGAEKAFQLALPDWAGRPGVVEQNLARLKEIK
jgi:Flp pilus assembly protein TadD